MSEVGGLDDSNDASWIDSADTAPSSDTTKSGHEDILTVATELFSELGYERTTVRLLAQRLGLQSGSLYSRISSKSELLKEIVLSVGNDFIARIENDRRQAASPIDVLRAMCRSHLQVIDQRLSAVSVYFNEWKKLDAAAQAQIVELRERYESGFRAVVGQAVDLGLVEDRKARLTVLALLSCLNWTYTWYRPGGRWSADDVADGIWEVLISGVLVGSPSNRCVSN